MAEGTAGELSYTLTLHDLATPQYQQAVQRFKTETREVTDAVNAQEEACRRLCRAIAQCKEQESQAAKVWTQAEVAQERFARGLSDSEKALRRFAVEHARLPWSKFNEGAEGAAGAARGFAKHLKGAISDLGKMPGSLGEVGRAFGGIGRAVTGALGPVGSAVAVFTLSYNATRKLVDALGLFPDPMEKVKAANIQARVAAEAVAEAFERQRDVWVETLEKEAAYADKAIAKADQQAAAYLRLQRAREAVNKAVGDGVMLEMERAKYEDMLTAGGQYGAYKDTDGNIRTGGPLEAAQVGAYHDVLMAQERQRLERERADREIALAEEELAAKEATLAKAKRAKQKTNDEAEVKAYKRRDAADELYQQEKRYYETSLRDIKRLDPEDEDDARKLKTKMAEARTYKDRMDKAKAKLDAAERNLDRFLSVRDRQQGGVDSRNAEIDELRQQVEEKRAQRANLDELQGLELSKLEDAYNKIVLDAEREEREAWEKDVRERAERERQLKEENDRIAHERAMRNAREEAEYAARVAGEGDRAAQSRLQAAQGMVARAWGFYRDPGRLAAYGKEMDAEAAAREQYTKDYRSIVQGRRQSYYSDALDAMRKGGQDRMEGLFTDWRKRKRLSVNEEATIRVAVAEKEQQDAARAAIETAANTRRAVESLKAIEKALEEN